MTSIPRQDTSLIPRKVLFGDPDRARVRLSHDGKWLSFLAPKDGVLNLWVAPALDHRNARPLTSETERSITRYQWAYDNKHIVFSKDKGGDENWYLIALDVESGAQRVLSPDKDVQANLLHASPQHPREVLVGLNDRDPKWHDVYRIDVTTGKRQLVYKNEERFSGFLADDGFRLRVGIKQQPDGSDAYFDLTAVGKKREEPMFVVPHEDVLTTGPFTLDPQGRNMVMVDSRQRNTAALFEFNLATHKATLLAQDEKADVQNVLVHPRTQKVQAASSNYERVAWQIVDPDIRPDMEVLKTAYPGDLSVVDRSLDNERWVVAYELDDGPTRYARYDRKDKKVTFLFTSRSSLEGLRLAKMHPVVIRSRDGLELVSYLTLPVDSNPQGGIHPSSPLPLVLFVHGGPWSRDEWGYDSYHQWLANRGYAVLSVNYRGSTGFGKRFVNAGDKQWAAKMHDDLLDAVRWAIDEKVAIPDKVAIMGGSYGGYATLVGLTFTPEVFACGVDIVGPSNLLTLLQTIPPYWEPMIEMFTKRVGDHRTESGRALLRERSPLFRVDKILRPLLIGQGANDPRVKQSESDQIVKAMQKKDIPVTYILYPDEGHGFVRAENRMSFNAIAEIFLAQCLQGPYDPIGNDFNGSSLTVPVGAEAIYGLPGALPTNKTPGK
jgi:dipeptidyl aminopeptidase/acylaminoacyl peptidase